MSTRVYLLSKRLGISNRELIDLLQAKGFDVSSASSSVADIYAEDILKEFGQRDVASGEEEENVLKTGSSPKSAATENFSGLGDVDVAGVNSRGNVGKGSDFVQDGGVRQRSGEMPETKAPPPVPSPPEKVQGSRPPQRERIMPQLLKVPSKESPVERPRMIPLERLQSSIRAQYNRFNGRNERHSGEKFPFHDRRGPQQQLGGGDGRSGRDFHGGRTDRFGENRPFSPGLSRPGIPGSGGQELRRGDFRAPARQVPAAPKPMESDVFRPRPAPVVPAQQFAIPMAAEFPSLAAKKILPMKFPVSVREFAPEIGLKPFQLISELMQMGIFASMNYLMDEPIAQKVAGKFGFSVEVRRDPIAAAPVQRVARAKRISPDITLEERPPIVCVLGHVDHGKTTLLDAIRRTSVAAGEAGGITQHIGAYGVECGGRKITFIDTPGHAAFSKMRERGANLTDIAILVVAADDGFMPQTDEALKFAQKAGVPVVVAINKMDAKGANLDRVKQQMQQRGIASEDWGGETLCTIISALKGEGIQALLELILVQAEMLALQADYHGPVQGVVVESQVEVGRGPTASAIVQEGTLKVGDALVCGVQFCKVRSLVGDRGQTLEEASPSTPVKISGWSGPLEVGAVFVRAESEKVARAQADENRLAEEAPAGDSLPQERGRRRQDAAKGSLDVLFAAINAKQKKTLRVVLRADVRGSAEALSACLNALPQEKIELEILQEEVGLVSKGDVEFSVSSGAVIVAFNTKMENGVQALLKQHGVRLLQHNIIYMIIEQVRDAMADLLEPEIQEEKLGVAQVRQVFTLSKGVIAGCMVTEGKIIRDALARIHREGKQISEGKITSLRRTKEDATEVRAGYECGISLSNYEFYQVGDSVECYKINKIRPNL
ncbi:MAG: translation initiation factor IF-2 [Puniceicoccales bacterium]|nr:translation initiation factor IF-2 [Puniceicoccales bacterium]